MSPDERRGLARSLLDNPLTEILLGELEASAINQCINAPFTDHETRAAFAAEARAIRSFRSKLNLSIQEAPATKGAPA